ncbi:Uncharacterised protein [Burkholderia pseudomallei]|nr:Uncharacterised protein [Burkholderia pseudomallei]
MRIAAGSVCRQRGRRWHRCRYRPRCRHARGAVQARADSRPGARPSDSSGRRDARRRVHRASPAIHAPASASRLYANCSKANPARSRADASIASASPVRACHSGCRAHGRAAGCGVVGRLVRARLPAVFIRRNLRFAKWLTARTRQKARVPENTGLQTADEPHVFVSVGFCLSGIRIAGSPRAGSRSCSANRSPDAAACARSANRDPLAPFSASAPAASQSS